MSVQRISPAMKIRSTCSIAVLRGQAVPRLRTRAPGTRGCCVGHSRQSASWMRYLLRLMPDALPVGGPQEVVLRAPPLRVHLLGRDEHGGGSGARKSRSNPDANTTAPEGLAANHNSGDLFAIAGAALYRVAAVTTLCPQSAGDERNVLRLSARSVNWARAPERSGLPDRSFPVSGALRRGALAS